MRTTTPKSRRPSRNPVKPLSNTGILNIRPNGTLKTTYRSSFDFSKTAVKRFTNVVKRSKPATPKRQAPQSASHRRRNSLMEPAKSTTNRHSRKVSLENEPIPVVAKFAHLSRQGVIPGNPGKVNQDAFFECLNFGPRSNMCLFGVCDGHGQFGHFVSDFVKQRLPCIISQDKRLSFDVRHVLHDSILQCNEELKQLELDTNFSGTTLVLVLIKDKTLWCANVGDSRAVVGRQLADESAKAWMAIALSRDHKPDLPEEESRILSAGGRVASYEDENGDPAGPARVWLRHEDVPGLAMSRSLGDELAASVGVSSVPEILEFQLTAADKFILLGSDGVFEFISNEEAVKLVIPYWTVQDPEGSVATLERTAVLRWREEEDVIDDITSLAVFLDVFN